jgi:hypothetical protein
MLAAFVGHQPMLEITILIDIPLFWNKQNETHIFFFINTFVGLVVREQCIAHCCHAVTPVTSIAIEPVGLNPGKYMKYEWRFHFQLHS